MPATFSFLEWNSVGFSLLANLSMGLVFSQREAPCGAGVVYVRHIAREMQGSEQCVGGRTSPGWTWDEGTAQGGTCEPAAPARGGCLTAPHLSLLWLKFRKLAKCKFLTPLYGVCQTCARLWNRSEETRGESGRAGWFSSMSCSVFMPQSKTAAVALGRKGWNASVLQHASEVIQAVSF